MGNKFLTAQEYTAAWTKIIDDVCRKEAGDDEKKYNQLRTSVWDATSRMFFYSGGPRG